MRRETTGGMRLSPLSDLHAKRMNACTHLFDVENDLKLNPVLAQCTTKYGERAAM